MDSIIRSTGAGRPDRAASRGRFTRNDRLNQTIHIDAGLAGLASLSDLDGVGPSTAFPSIRRKRDDRLPHTVAACPVALRRLLLRMYPCAPVLPHLCASILLYSCISCCAVLNRFVALHLCMHIIGCGLTIRGTRGWTRDRQVDRHVHRHVQGGRSASTCACSPPDTHTDTHTEIHT